jgi:hypothetical protein
MIGIAILLRKDHAAQEELTLIASRENVIANRIRVTRRRGAGHEPGGRP